MFIILCVFLENALSQEQYPSDQISRITENTNCETTEVELHTAYLNFKDKGLDNSYLIIIGKGGIGEKKSYNYKRILQVVNYFLKLGIDKNRIISAQGEPKDKFGYVEILINGKLILNMRTTQKNTFCTSCCEGE